MGTRRSRHNKGRKPLYKEHRSGLSQVLEKVAEFQTKEWDAFGEFVRTHFPEGPKCPQCGSADHYLVSTRKNFHCASCGKFYSVTYNTPFKAHKLPFTKINQADKMTPCSVTALSSALGITYRAAWQLRNRLAEHRTAWKQRIRHSAGAVMLSYPYIMKSRAEYADLLAVNKLVPRALDPDMRADICQEMMLALLDGRTTLDELVANRNNTRFFVKKFFKDNFEGSGRTLSLQNYDEWSSNEVASRIAAREWWHGEQVDLSVNYCAVTRRFHHPSQIDDVWRNEIAREHERLHDEGVHLDRYEVEESLAE